LLHLIRPPLLPALVGLALTLACGEAPVESPGLPVVIDGVYDQTVDFSTYQTYNLVEIHEGAEAPPRGYTQANRRAVRTTIHEELHARGLTYDPEDPDLVIAPFIRLTAVEVHEEKWWWSGYWGWYWGYASPWHDENLHAFDAGSLVIDAVDIGDPDDEDDDVLVFRATATALFPNRPVNWADRIADAVVQMFEYWPSEGPS
jgi:hypothetical protein